MADRSVFIDAGKRGARKRWGDAPKSVRLDALTPEQRRLVVLLVEAQQAANRADPAKAQ
jgi:hypothetical protein